MIALTGVEFEPREGSILTIRRQTSVSRYYEANARTTIHDFSNKLSRTRREKTS